LEEIPLGCRRKLVDVYYLRDRRLNLFELLRLFANFYDYLSSWLRNAGNKDGCVL
jgi:hypothetical protein